MSNPNRFLFNVGDDLLPPAERPHSITTAGRERQHLQQLPEHRGLRHGLPHANPLAHANPLPHANPSAGLANHLSDALRRARNPWQAGMGHLPSQQQQQTKRDASAHASHPKVEAIRTGGSTYLAAPSQQRALPVPGHSSYAPPIEEDWLHAPRNPDAEPTNKRGVSMQEIAALSSMIPQKRQRRSNPDACPLNRSGGVYVEDTADLAEMMARKRRWEQQTIAQSEKGGMSSSSSSSSSKKKSVHFKDDDGIEMMELQRITTMSMQALESMGIDTDADTDAELEGWETAVEDGDKDADWCLIKGDGEEVETEEEWCMVAKH